MSKKLERGILTAFVLGAAVATGLPAWPAPGGTESEARPAEPAELHAAMQEYFQKRLRAELALSDEQSDRIVPLARELVEARRAVQRARGESARELRRGLEQGATDAELERALERLDRMQLEHDERDRSIMQEIDKGLSIRQRVQLRFFMERFRREMQDKVHELRGGPGRRDLPPRRGPGRDGP